MMEKIKKTPLNRNVASPRSFVNFKTRCIQMSLTILCLLALVVLQSCSNANTTTTKTKCSLTFNFGREFTIETDDVINLPNNGAGFEVNGNLSDNHYWTVVQVPKATNATTIAFNYDPRYVPPVPPMPGVTVGPYALVYSKAACPLTVTDQSYMIMPDFSIMQTNYDYTESTMTVSFTSPGDYSIISAPTIQSAMAAVTRTN